MRQPVTVVEIRSLSYTGTTFINLMLASHETGFAVGPPARIIDLLEKEGETGSAACLVHRDACGFWPRFFEQYDRSGNFYLQLAAFSGRNLLVINNPSSQENVSRHLQHPDLQIRRVNVVRDGRAVCHSYCRHHPPADYFDAVRDWFAPFAPSFPFDPTNPDELSVRYEDVVADVRSFMRQAGAFLGVDFGDRAHRFWEFEHHLTSGNQGPWLLMRRFNGVPYSGPDAAYREEEYQRLLADPNRPLVDRRWQEDVGRRERLVFDYYAGEINGRWGYERDTFNTTELREFVADLDADPAQTPASGDKTVRKGLLSRVRAGVQAASS